METFTIPVWNDLAFKLEWDRMITANRGWKTTPQTRTVQFERNIGSFQQKFEVVEVTIPDPPEVQGGEKLRARFHKKVASVVDHWKWDPEDHLDQVVLTYLAKVIKQIEVDGQYHKQKVTASRARDQTNWEEFLLKAKVVVDWLQGLRTSNDAFLAKLYHATYSGYFCLNDIGIVASAVPSYEKEITRRENLVMTKHFGTVGDRVDLGLTIREARHSEMYDVFWTDAVDDEGHVFSFAYKHRLPSQAFIAIRGTIKAHAESKAGECVTRISRPSILGSDSPEILKLLETT